MNRKANQTQMAGGLAVVAAIVAIGMFLWNRGPTPGEVVKSPLPRSKEVREILVELNDVPPLLRASAEFKVPGDLREDVMRFFEGRTYVMRPIPEKTRKNWSLGTIRLILNNGKRVEVQLFMGGKGGTSYRIEDHLYNAKYFDDDGGMTLVLLLDWVRRNRPAEDWPRLSASPPQAGAAGLKSGSLKKSHSSPSAP